MELQKDYALNLILFHYALLKLAHAPQSIIN